MIKKDIERYKCILTPLTNIHIGSGNELSTYDYVIKDDIYYRIILEEIFFKLPDEKKQKLITLMENGNVLKIREYIKLHYKEEYGYEYKAKVSNEFLEKYKSKLGGVKDKNENNLLTISEFIGNYKGKYIPGSSIKGAIRSAVIGDKLKCEYKIYRNNEIKTKPFYSRSEDENRVKQDEAKILGLKNLNPQLDPFKNLVVTDTEIKNDLIEIGEFSRIGINSNGIAQAYEILRGYLVSGKKTNISFKINISIHYDTLEKKLKNIQGNDFVELKNLYMDKDDWGEDIALFYALDKKSECLLNEELKYFEKFNTSTGKKLYEAYKKLLEIQKNLKDNEVLVKFGEGMGFNAATLNIFNKNKQEIATRVISENYPVGWAILSYTEIEEEK